MNKNNKIYNVLRYIAITGNILYFLWILYNGISEGFADIATVENISLIGLMVLLLFNIFLFFRK
jgi:hypothetical protein